MGGFFSYTLIASVFILLLYPVLHQIVNRSSYYRFNRTVIICCMVLCFSISYFFDANAISFVPFVNYDLVDNGNSQFIDTAISGYIRQNNMTNAFPWLAI